MFSVIIPTCNRDNLLGKCLDALHTSLQYCSIDHYEIIVSDDSHNDNTKFIIKNKYKWVKWVAGPRNGIGANRNNGVANATYSWIIFIDDDTIPQKDLFNEYQKAITTHKSCLAFEGSIEPDNWNLVDNEFAECPINISGGNFWTANVCINKKLFEYIGGFDENLKFFNEDQDIYLRLKEHTEVIFLRTAIVLHPIRFTSLKKKLVKSKKAYSDYKKFKLKTLSNFEIVKTGYLFHLTSIKGNLVRKRWSNIINSLYHLIWLIPVNYFKK